MNSIRKIKQKIKKHKFLFEELVKRDFKQKYKNTILGMLWSVLSPLLTLLIMGLVFTRFFGRTIDHYKIYVFCGNIVFSFYKESTSNGMKSLLANAGIFTKVKVPKYLFLLSRNVSALINFGLTILVFLVLCLIDRVAFTWRFFMLLYPVVFLTVFNVGVGLILSALYVFFRDTNYLYDIFNVLLMYLSAIFYNIDAFPANVQRLFLCNPVYVYINYFRLIVLKGIVPSFNYHCLCAFYALAAIAVGGIVYKKNNTRFLYYV